MKGAGEWTSKYCGFCQSHLCNIRVTTKPGDKSGEVWGSLDIEAKVDLTEVDHSRMPMSFSTRCPVCRSMVKVPVMGVSLPGEYRKLL